MPHFARGVIHQKDARPADQGGETLAPARDLSAVHLSPGRRSFGGSVEFLFNKRRFDAKRLELFKTREDALRDRLSKEQHDAEYHDRP
jgi:hypothetical protein